MTAGAVGLWLLLGETALWVGLGVAIASGAVPILAEFAKDDDDQDDPLLWASLIVSPIIFGGILLAILGAISRL